MIRFLKQTFYTFLLIGVVGSFLLRCSSPGKVENSSEEAAVERSAAPVVNAPRPQESAKVVSSPAEKSVLTAAEFRDRADRILMDLPTEDVVKANRLSEDHHETPASIVASGRLLGEVKDKMMASPENIPVGLDFYSKCAGDRNVVVQVKALCLRNLRDWETKIGQKHKTRFAKDVEKLAAQLPKTRF